jgi:hypothetical protein
VKFWTVSVTVMLWTLLPLVPVMVSVEVPPATVAGTVTVNVEVPDPVTDVGLNAAVALVGNPLTVKAVAPVRPAVAVTVTVNVPVPPATTVRVVGEDDSEKSGVTVSVAGMDCTSEPLVPVMVKG